VFDLKDGELTQFVSSRLIIRLDSFDLSSSDQKETLAHNKVHEFTLKPFDLKNGPLIRAGLIILDETNHILMISFHHTILDHTAVLLFFNELSTIYEKFKRNKTPD